MGVFREQREPSAWRTLAVRTWGRPSDPTVYGVLELDATSALAYVEALRESAGLHVTLTHLVGKAAACAIAERPEVNAVIRRGRRIYLRDTVDVFFQVATDHGENLSGAVIKRADDKSVAEIAAELQARTERLRSHRDREVGRAQTRLTRLPSPLIGPAMRVAEYLGYDLGVDLRRFGLPHDAFGSVMITNVGVFGLPLGFAPLLPFSRAPILLTLGAIRDAPRAVDGEVCVRPVLPIGATFDHRLLDGYQAGHLVRRFTEVITDPERHLGRVGARASRP